MTDAFRSALQNVCNVYKSEMDQLADECLAKEEIYSNEITALQEKVANLEKENEVLKGQCKKLTNENIQIRKELQSVKSIVPERDGNATKKKGSETPNSIDSGSQEVAGPMKSQHSTRTASAIAKSAIHKRALRSKRDKSRIRWNKLDFVATSNSNIGPASTAKPSTAVRTKKVNEASDSHSGSPHVDETFNAKEVAPSSRGANTAGDVPIGGDNPRSPACVIPETPAATRVHCPKSITGSPQSYDATLPIDEINDKNGDIVVVSQKSHESQLSHSTAEPRRIRPHSTPVAHSVKRARRVGSQSPKTPKRVGDRNSQDTEDRMTPPLAEVVQNPQTPKQGRKSIKRKAEGLENKGCRNDHVNSVKNPLLYKEVVRNKDARSAMPAVECEDCKKFYDILGEEHNLRHHNCQKYGRHRTNNPTAQTPPGFWAVGFTESNASDRSPS